MRCTVVGWWAGRCRALHTDTEISELSLTSEAKLSWSRLLCMIWAGSFRCRPPPVGGCAMSARFERRAPPRVRTPSRGAWLRPPQKLSVPPPPVVDEVPPQAAPREIRAVSCCTYS